MRWLEPRICSPLASAHLLGTVGTFAPVIARGFRGGMRLCGRQQDYLVSKQDHIMLPTRHFALVVQPEREASPRPATCSCFSTPLQAEPFLVPVGSAPTALQL